MLGVCRECGRPTGKKKGAFCTAKCEAAWNTASDMLIGDWDADFLRRMGFEVLE